MMAVIIRLQNLPLTANASSIRNFFEGLKIPDGGVNIVGGNDGDAFIAFATDDDARQAMHLNGLKINGSVIRLLLSSKQEMQSIITEAQNRVLKRSVTTPPTEVNNPIDKRSISYFYPNVSSNSEHCTSNSSKMRIIDHSENENESFIPSNNNNKENNSFIGASCSNEFLHGTVREMPQSAYRYITPEYVEYSSNYNTGAPYSNPNKESSSNLLDNDEYYKELQFQKSLLPTPPVQDFSPMFHRGRSDYFRQEQQRDNRHSEGTAGSSMSQNYQPDNFGAPRPDRPFFSGSSYRHHDYRARPEWLQEQKQSFTPPPPSQLPSCNSCLVRLTLPPSVIAHKTVFDMFRNINIVPKRGIKIEVDEEKRLTGYVYVLLVSISDTIRALQLNNNKGFRGIDIIIDSMKEEDFDKVVECSDQFVADADKPIFDRSPYYRDLCIEISNIPLDITERDLKDYLNISINNRNLHFVQQGGSGYCLITANNESMMLDILKFNGVSYRGSVIKVLAISKYQLQTYLRHRTAVKSVSPRSNTDQINTNKCAKFENLTENIGAIDLQKLFLPEIIPLRNIIVRGSECIVDLVNLAICKRVINDLKMKHAVQFTINLISYDEYRSLKASYLDAPGGPHSVVVKSESRSPWRASTPTCEVRIKNFPKTINNVQIEDLIVNFEFPPRAIRICYDHGRNLGEAILTFNDPSEAVEFKDEFHGVWFMQKTLEVLLSEN